MGPTGCPETSVRNYHYTPRNNPEERSFIYFAAAAWKHAGKSLAHVGSRIIRLTTPCPRNKFWGSERCDKDSSQQSGRLRPCWSPFCYIASFPEEVFLCSYPCSFVWTSTCLLCCRGLPPPPPPPPPSSPNGRAYFRETLCLSTESGWQEWKLVLIRIRRWVQWGNH
jgi:hypothetical protein